MGCRNGPNFAKRDLVQELQASWSECSSSCLQVSLCLPSVLHFFVRSGFDCLHYLKGQQVSIYIFGRKSVERTIASYSPTLPRLFPTLLTNAHLSPEPILSTIGFHVL